MKDRRAYVYHGGDAVDEIHAETLRKIRAVRLAEVEPASPDSLWDRGTYKGMPIRDLPIEYLRWVNDEFLRTWPSERPLIAAALIELKNREQRGAE